MSEREHWRCAACGHTIEVAERACPEGPCPVCSETKPPPASCCPYRRKIVMGVLAVLTEEQCGVPDSFLADLVNFNIEAPTGHPVIAVQYCPWCGKKRLPGDETRVTDFDVEDNYES